MSDPLWDERCEAEVFTIKEGPRARYWIAQALPVLRVICSSEGGGSTS